MRIMVLVGPLFVIACGSGKSSTGGTSGDEGAGGWQLQDKDDNGVDDGADEICLQAAQHARDCSADDVADLVVEHDSTGDHGECLGGNRCRAKCVSAAECEALTGDDEHGAARYMTCLGDCAN